ncbi:MAG: DUF5050 domain-containing protein, partial [Bacillota bacterium]|nr:DUF5050 domain-containing protein [Bacillota bacterium]
CVILLLYIEHEELVVRTEELTEDSEDSIVLKISRLDGTEERVLDNNVSGPMNYFKGWIYYAKKDGIYKIKIDGTEKQKIFNLNNETGMLDIYNGRIYIGILDSTDLNGKHFRHQSVPDIPIGYSFIEKGCFYYAAITEDDEGGDCWSIYRYNLKTGAAKELLRDAMGSLIVRDGMAYYCSGNGIERTDGEKTEIVLQDEYSESISCMYYTLYRNYILFFTGADGEKLCACDINTGKVYELFSSDILPQIDISVMENSVFLYTGFKDDPIYRITFENNKAKLWELNGL